LKTKGERTKNVKQRRREEIEWIESKEQQESLPVEQVEDGVKTENRSYSNQLVKLPRRKK
ncbi:hypothetical protein, partial [Vibrio cholerae]